MCTKEQTHLIIEQIDVINKAKTMFSGLDIIMTMAAHSERKIDLTGEDIGSLAWLIKDAIMEPIFEAAEKIYQVVKEGGAKPEKKLQELIQEARDKGEV
ncbi:MAG: hypothetical protein ACE144_18825 [Thermodesulfobacteriota bacterium]